MKVVLVYNPDSGSTKSLASLRQLFGRYAITIEQAVLLTEGFEKKLAPHIAKEAYIAVSGGDGTISAVAGLLTHTKAVLVPLPGGTLNHFTKDLGIVQTLEEVVRNLRDARIHTVDLASVNERYFINNSGVGLYPSSLRLRARFEDRLGKWPAALVASIRALLRFRMYHLEIDRKLVQTPFVFVGNNIYDLGVVGAAERHSLNEAVLSVFIAKTGSRWQLAKVAAHALVGKSHLLDEFEEKHVTAVRIESTTALLVSRDGEVERLSPPLNYTIHSRALRVLY
jgi:diacylglycerol kinase family enzyme